MSVLLDLDIMEQPDDTTCGPTCLHALYRYYGEDFTLKRIIDEVQSLEGGGTLAVLLACHALRRHYKARIYTYNLHIFDPTWFNPTVPDLAERLERQGLLKNDPKLRFATKAYIEYLALGGKMEFKDLTHALIRRHLKAGNPILTGLSATYLYNFPRENPKDCSDDDIGGYPSGHFVILYGYNRVRRTVMVADPLTRNEHYYEVEIHRLVSAILLGIVTYDANLLVIEPGREKKEAAL